MSPTRPKILYLINSLGAGGAERQLVDLINGINQQRYELYIVTLHNNENVPYHYDKDIDNSDIPITSIDIPFPPKWTTDFLPGIANYIKVVRSIHPNIIQTAGFMSDVISRLAKPIVPQHNLVSTIHEVLAPKRLYANIMTQISCTKIIANSATTHNQLKNARGISQKKVGVIHCGIPRQRFVEATADKLPQTFKLQDKFIFACVARISTIKDQLTLLKAVKLLKEQNPELEFIVLFIGMISEQVVYDEMQRYITQHQLQNHVAFPPVTDDIAAYYALADVTILPSLSESFGLVTVESMTTGTPVIVSEAANAAGAVHNNENGWIFATGDAQALAKCMVTVMHLQKDELDEFGHKAQESVAKFSLDTMVSNYQALYQNLIHNSD